jgi:uncharacterized protein
MEPFDLPHDNPGPHTLVADAAKVSNSDKLTWLMSRFTGYAGVANFLGGKFTADEKALAPVLREIAARGLFYVDDGSSARSLAMTLAPGEALTAARADIVLDSTARPEAIEAALARLEAQGIGDRGGRARFRRPSKSSAISPARSKREGLPSCP